MNSPIPWIMIAIAVIIVLLGIAAIFMKKKYKQPTDYYSFFIIGSIWTIFGAYAFFRDNDYSFSGFFGMGIVFLIVGLINKDKWKANHRTWNQMTPEEKKFKYIIIGALGILVLAGLVAFLLVEKNTL